ncbi:hypothetical protein AB5J56_09540 [Streptomyces sp. R21]|uniref:Uncharacterized protein n=1 Tax=Streptomyces sp. R21 TaxID=3238627 RepID=A0AB39PPP2_9ACTN
MPVLALLSAVFVVGFEQLVQWQYGLTGIIGLLLLTIGIKAKEPTSLLEALRAPSRTAGLAGRIAGRRRTHYIEEWASVLAGDPEHGVTLSPLRRQYYALGFVCAAVRMRLHDLLGGFWTPVDWTISTRQRSNFFIASGVGVQVVMIQLHDGLYVLCTDGLGWAAGCGIALRLLVGWLRQVRGIELAAVDRPDADDE